MTKFSIIGDALKVMVTKSAFLVGLEATYRKIAAIQVSGSIPLKGILVEKKCCVLF
jgi:hypothetical protein